MERCLCSDNAIAGQPTTNTAKMTEAPELKESRGLVRANE